MRAPVERDGMSSPPPLFQFLDSDRIESVESSAERARIPAYSIDSEWELRFSFVFWGWQMKTPAFQEARTTPG